MFRSSLALMVMIFLGCRAEQPSQEGDQLFARDTQALFGAKYWYWSKSPDGVTRVPVCWRSAGADVAKTWVRSSVEGQWGSVASIQFTGWGLCDASTPSNAVRIELEDNTTAPRSYVGENNQNPSMWLNFTFANWSPSCASKKEYCIRGIALHEFGHALGFYHEQDRPDNQGQCNEGVQTRSDGDLLGAYDRGSVMNYCVNPWGPNALSPGDIQGVRQIYGASKITKPLFVGFKSNDSFDQLFLTGSADGLHFQSPASGYPGLHFQGSPAMAVFNNRLYVAFRSDDSRNLLFVTSSADGYNFQTPATGYSSISLQDSPAMAAFNGRLYIAFRANDASNSLYVASSADGINFQSSVLSYPDIRLQGSPALAVFNNKLYIAFRSNDSRNLLFVTSSADGYNFQTPAVEYSSIKLQGNPALAAFNGRLHLAFRSNDSRNLLFMTSSADGYNFAPATEYANIQFAESPALAAFDGRLHLAFRANDSRNLLFVTSSADGYNFAPATEYPGIALANSPAIVFFNP